MPRPGSRGLKTKFSTPLRTLIPQLKTSTTAKGWQADVLCGRCPAFYLLRLASKAASSRAARVLASLPLLAEALRDRAGAVERAALENQRSRHSKPKDIAQRTASEAASAKQSTRQAVPFLFRWRSDPAI